MGNKQINVVAGVISRKDTVLIGKRRANDSLPGKWEFPGGTIEKGESHEECLARELQEELGIETRMGELIGVTEHPYPRGIIEIHTYHADWISGTIVPTEHDDIAWPTRKELLDYDLAPGDIPIAKKLIAETSSDS